MSLKSLLFQVSDVFTIMLSSRSSSCSYGRLMPLLLPLITGCAVNGAKRYRQPPRRTPLCLSFITTRRGLQPHSVRREVVAHLKDPILLHYRLPRIRLQMPDVTFATAETTSCQVFNKELTDSRFLDTDDTVTLANLLLVGPLKARSFCPKFTTGFPSQSVIRLACPCTLGNSAATFFPITVKAAPLSTPNVIGSAAQRSNP